MGTPAELCEYCFRIAKLPGSLFCCEGCEFLFGLENRPHASLSGPDRSTIPASQESRVLVETFGAVSAGVTRFQCEVDALACEACLQSLARIERYFPALQDLRWNRNLSRLSFQFKQGSEEPSRVEEFLRLLKLNPRWIRPEDHGHGRANRRSQLLRLAVTGALAGNIMMFAFAIYFGLSGEWKSLFEFFQALLFLPVFFWSAQPILRTAWVSLRLRQLSVDLPLGVAFLSGSVLSYFAWWRGTGDVYFDSLAGFLFLILLSRYILDESLAVQLREPSLSSFFSPPVLDVQRDGQSWERMDVLRIQKNDLVRVRSQDRIPVDGVLRSEAAELDMSWLDGEPEPRVRLKGSVISAGSKLLSSQAELQATGAVGESVFAGLLKQLSSGGEKISTTTEARIGAALVLICFVLSLGILLAGPALGYESAFERILALLIVACPCAISFAAPLARARASFLARKLGFWVRDPSVFEKLKGSLKIAFDKTGTLTDGILTLAQDSPIVDDNLKKVILSLENISQHPIADSFRKVWGQRELFNVENAKEVVGVGVSGRINGSDYQLKRGMDRDGRAVLDLFRNGQLILQLGLMDNPKPEVQRALEQLSQHDLYIVSGDAPPRVHDLARKVGIPVGHSWGGLTPEGKADVLGKISPDIYIGDGANDLLALNKTPVAISTPAAAAEAKSAADVLMMGADVQQLNDFLKIAQETQIVVRRNFGFALIYNLLAGTGAILGFINPFVAALLMPASSLLLIASTLWGSEKLRKIGGRV